MKNLFIVFRTHGAAWTHGRSLEEQADWSGHAAFMDDLEREGFVVLGGPLEGSPDALLVLRAGSEDEIHSRLAADPWSGSDHLRTTRVNRWTLRLGSLP
jgi:uncharacterized protein YciI